MDKSIASLSAAVAGIEDGMTVMVGGFGGSGSPIELIHALIDRFNETGHPKDLTVVNNNAGNGHIGLAALIEAGMVRKSGSSRDPSSPGGMPKAVGSGAGRSRKLSSSSPEVMTSATNRAIAGPCPSRS